MSHRKILGILLGLSVVGFGVGVAFTEPEIFGTCRDGYGYQYGENANPNNPPAVGCMDPLGDTLGQPLGMGSVALLIVFLTLFFLPRVYFAAWGKYAAWFIAVAVVWIAVTPAQCSSGFGLTMCMDKELVTWWASGIFLVISLITVIWTRLKL